MADSKRQTIVNAIQSRLETILTAGGYETNAGLNVFNWRDNPLMESELPALVWRDLDDVVVLSVGRDVHRLRIEIDCIQKGTAAPALMRKLIADVVVAIGTDLTFGGLVEDTILVEEAVQVDQVERKFAAVQISIDVEFETNHFDPYN